MQQIASGADEAAGASREQLAAIDSIVAHLGTSRAQSEASHRRTEAVRSVLGDASSQMTISIQASPAAKPCRQVSVARMTVSGR
jgi:methyl-accepting chemotaxis protein